MDHRERGLLLGPLLSVLLGLLSLLLLLRLVTGVPALVLGLICLRRLNALDEDTPKTRWGKRLAVGGMVLGAAGCVLGVLGLTSLGLLQFGESSRRVTCADHMRKIGKAVENYAELHRDYPPATMDGADGLAGFAPWLDEPYPQRLGWMVSVLPFLERPSEKPAGPFETLYQKFEPRLGWDAPANRGGVNTTMRGFLCPSHPFYDPEQRPARSHYVGITGTGEEAVELPMESPGAGFFGYTRRLRTIAKGTGYVSLLSETMTDNGPWAAGDRSTLRGFEPKRKPYLGYERPFGGMHPGGANLLTVDGAVRFYTDRTAPAVLEGLATLAGEGER
jgi:prepilin-type processing-associated H-X9-DG protein